MDLGDLLTSMGRLLRQPPQQGAAFGTLSPSEQAEVPPNALDKIVAGAANALAGAASDLATLPKRAIDAAAEDVQHLGEPDYQLRTIQPALETAMTLGGSAMPFAERARSEFSEDAWPRQRIGRRLRARKR